MADKDFPQVGISQASSGKVVLDFDAAAALVSRDTKKPDFDAAAATLRDNAARQSLLGVAGVNPDKQAEINRLAQSSGLPPLAVEGNEDKVKSKLDFDAAIKSLNGAPTTSIFLSDPKNAGVASDAVSSLAGIEQSAGKLSPLYKPRELLDFRNTRAVISAPLDFFGQAVEGIGVGLGVASRAISAPFYDTLKAAGFGDVADAIKNVSTGLPGAIDPVQVLTRGGLEVRKVAGAIAPPSEQQDLGTDVAGGLSQLAAQAAALVYLGPTTAVMALFGQGVAQQADDADASKALPGPELDSALITGGAITATLEKMGINKLLKTLPGLNSLVGRVLSGATIEAVEEFSEKVLQNLTALVLYDPDKEITEGAIEEATPAGIVGGIVGVLMPGRRAISSKKAADDLHKEVLSSSMTERAPDQATQHLASVLAGHDIEEVYAPANKLLEMAADNPALASMLSKDKELFEEAQDQALVGGDVRLSSARFAAIIADAEAYPALAGHIRYGIDALTAFEAKDLTAQEVVRAEADKAAARAGQVDEVGREMGLAEEQIGLQALFQSAKDVGMTKETYAKYLEHVARVKDAGRVEQEKDRLEEEAAKLTVEYKAAFEVEREKVRESVHSSDPVYGAMEAIGIDRLDRAKVLALLPDGQGAALLDQLPKQQGGRQMFTRRGEAGMDPEILAARYGWDGADLMLFAMIQAKPVNEEIVARTEKVMNEKHPELVKKREGVKAAIENLHNDTTADLIAYELNAIRQANKQGAMKPAMIRAEAVKRFGKMKLNEISPERFVNAQRRAAATAGKLIRGSRANGYKTDRDGAARAKFQQLMNHHYARLAYAAKRRVEKERRKLIKLSNPRKKQPGIDAAYMNVIREWLEQVNLLPKLTEGRRERLTERAQELADKTGGIFVVPPLILADDTRVHYENLTVAEWAQFYEHVRAAETQGRRVKQIGKGAKQRHIDDVVADLLADSVNIVERPRAKRQRENQNPGLLDRVISNLVGVDAAVVKVEFLLKRLGDAWHKALFQPISAAQTAQLDFTRKHLEPLILDLEKLSKKIKKPLMQKIRVASLNRTFARSDLLMLALNVGNTSNMLKVLEGSKKDNGSVPWTEASISEALGALTPEEAGWVQRVWDTFEKVYPQIEEIYRAEHGIWPKKIVGREVSIGGVQLTGGYFPMLYDTRRSVHASEARFDTALGMIQNPYVQDTVFSGMTEERTGYSAPVSLDLSKLQYQFQQLAHFITHYEVVRDTKNLITDERIARELENKLGREYRIELNSWLDAVATAGMNNADMTKFDEWAQVLRTNVTSAVMGASFTTGVSQTFGFANSVAVLGRGAGGKFSSGKGADWMMQGYEQYLANPAEVQRLAFSLSGEMRHRLANTDRELAHAMDSLVKRSGGLSGVAKSFFISWNRAALMMIGGVQLYAVDLPTWVAGFNQGTHAGMTQEEAVEHADSVLRMSQSTGHEKDLSHLQRKKGLWPAVTMFSSYTMLLYNLQRETYGDARKIKNVPGAIARLGWMIGLATLMDAMLRQERPEEPEELESWFNWFTGKSIGYATRAFPVVGGSVDALIKGFNPELSPIEGIGKSVAKLIKETGKAADEGPTMATVEAYTRVLGTVVGLGGTYQIGRVLSAIEAGDDADLYDYMIGYNENR